MSPQPVVHLVGSIPLEDADTVFKTVSAKVGANLSRLPDGETGKRIGWIKFLQDYLNSHPQMETDTEQPPMIWRQWDGVVLREVPLAKFKDGVDPKTVKFETGYADAAIESFAVFDRLQGEGAIPTGVKFQVCLPTPLAPAYNFVSPRAQSDFIPVFTDHMIAEVAKIASLPKDRIAIQWDVCQEILMWEGYYDAQRPNYKDEIFSVLGAIGDGVPEPVELGYHLCYGSPRDEHLVQPKDTANMVEMTRGIVAAVNRPVQFIHLPVPKERDDDAYFAPLKGLELPAATDLYLGLIHYADDAGDARRLAVAQKYTQVNGIGTECGWGRGDPDRIAGLLASHVKAAALV